MYLVSGDPDETRICFRGLSRPPSSDKIKSVSELSVIDENLYMFHKKISGMNGRLGVAAEGI